MCFAERTVMLEGYIDQGSGAELGTKIITADRKQVYGSQALNVDF